jgi:radical SAM-linked protein
MEVHDLIAVNGVTVVEFKDSIHFHVKPTNRMKQMIEEMLRLRLTYQKIGNIRFTGTLDMQKIWERSCRRTGLAIAYSHGFHPQARIQQAAPLPLGMEGLQEIVDIWFTGDFDLTHFAERINKFLPSGLFVHCVQKVVLNEKALQNRVSSATYLITTIVDAAQCQPTELINELLNSTSTMIEKKGRQINIRELINDITIQKDLASDQIEIWMNLNHQPGKTGRPEDVLKVIGIEPSNTRILRERLDY